MKRYLLLFLCIILAFPLSAMAYDSPQVRISPQSLRVDGRIVNCEKYNIDGYNYVRLRDLAALVSDTDSRFSVGYDQRSRMTKLVPGEDYTPDGSELMIIGDRADTAVETHVSLLIGDEQVNSISVYRIGSSLYFKLRDIAPCVHIKVEYDELRAMILLSTLTAAEKHYAVSEITRDAGGSAISTVSRSFDANGLLLSEIITTADGTETHDFTYDLNSLLVGETVYSDGTETCLEYQYDTNGNLATKTEMTSDGVICQTDFLYDELDRIIQETCVGSTDDYLLVCTYDDENMLAYTVCSFVSAAVQSSEITLDIAGNAVAEAIQYVAANYQAIEEIKRTFDAYGNVLNESSQFSDSEGVNLSSGFSFVRDSAGNALRCLWSDGSVTEYTQKTAAELAASATSGKQDVDLTGEKNGGAGGSERIGKRSLPCILSESADPSGQ